MKEFIRKIYRKFLPNTYLEELGKELKDCKNVLDLGCGFKSPIMNFPKTFYAVGIDIYEPYIETSKKSGIHDKYYNMDILKAGENFKPESFDCVLALGVIEHLSKKNGFKLMDIMEKLAKKKVIIFTPSGLLSSKKHNIQIGHDHKSGWTAKEFKELGYLVYGVNGWKYLKYDYADPDDNTQIRFKPKVFWKIVSDISQLILKNRPDSTYEILCIKKFS